MDPENIIQRTFDAAFKEEGGDANGEMEAVVATFDVKDRDSEIFKSGAINKYTEKAIPLIGVVQAPGAHQGARVPLGVGKVFQRGQEMIYSVVFLATEEAQKAREALKELLDKGGQQRFSIGFLFGTARFEPSFTSEEKALGARRIFDEIEPYEVSLAVNPSQFGTGVLGIKDGGGDGTQEDAEKAAQAAAAKEAFSTKAKSAAAAAAFTLTKTGLSLGSHSG